SIGYAFFSDASVSVTEEEVTRSRRFIRTSNPNTVVTKNVFGATYHHESTDGSDAVAYALLPGASADDMATYEGVEVLGNTADVQAIEHEALGLKAVNVFAADGGHAGGIEVDGPASVIAQRRPGGGADL